MLSVYAHALLFILVGVRGPLMGAASLVACGAAVTALVARWHQVRVRVAQPQAKILPFRPRTVPALAEEERRAA